MFSGIPTITFEASIAMCHFSLLVSARVLDDSHVLLISTWTRAVWETLPSHVHLVALLSQRAAVKSRHTLHELANPWKHFKCLVIF